MLMHAPYPGTRAKRGHPRIWLLDNVGTSNATANSAASRTRRLASVAWSAGMFGRSLMLVNYGNDDDSARSGGRSAPCMASAWATSHRGDANMLRHDQDGSGVSGENFRVASLRSAQKLQRKVVSSDHHQRAQSRVAQQRQMLHIPHHHQLVRREVNGREFTIAEPAQH